RRRRRRIGHAASAQSLPRSGEGLPERRDAGEWRSQAEAVKQLVRVSRLLTPAGQIKPKMIRDRRAQHDSLTGRGALANTLLITAIRTYRFINVTRINLGQVANRGLVRTKGILQSVSK